MSLTPTYNTSTGTACRDAEGAENRDAEGVEGWEMGRKCPPPSQLKGPGERRKLPERGAPAANAFWRIFSRENASDSSNFFYYFSVRN